MSELIRRDSISIPRLRAPIGPLGMSLADIVFFITYSCNLLSTLR